MEKKLTAQGPRSRKSYTVTIPIEWIKQQHLDKTRSVELEIVGNKVVISKCSDPERTTIIKEKEYKKTIVKILQGLYRYGVSEIKIFFDTNNFLGDILDIVEKRLLGYEVVEQKKDYVIIRDIVGESTENFMTVFRRIFLLLMQLSEASDPTEVSSLARTIRKFINYCQRILMRKGHADYRKTPIYYLILDRLEKIGDEFVWLSETKSSNPRIKELYSLLRSAYELFYTYNYEKYELSANKAYEMKNEIKLKENIKVETMHIHNIARLINSLYGDIYIIKCDAYDQ